MRQLHGRCEIEYARARGATESMAEFETGHRFAGAGDGPMTAAQNSPPGTRLIGTEPPTLDVAECAQFISFWCSVTGAPHITLTAITPDGPTTTATFTTADTEKAGGWIARHQGAGRNIYFQV